MRRLLAVLMLTILSIKAEVYTDASGTTWYYNIEDGTATIVGSSYATGAVSIPSEVNGISVKRLAHLIFGFPNSSVTSVNISEGITHIGNYTFNQCTSISNVTIPYSVTSIGEGAFFDNWSLTNMVIPNSVTTIGQYAFRNSYNLVTITFGSGVNYIGPEALRDCANLKEARFLGNAPVVEGDWWNCPAYVLRETGASGWGSTFAGRPVYFANGDLNSDGISDLQAIALGYDPAFNFFPLINFIKTNPVFRAAHDLFTTNQIHNLGLGGIVLNRSTNNQLVLNYQILQSPDLQNWSPYQQTELVITNAPSDKMFLRVQAVGQ